MGQFEELEITRQVAAHLRHLREQNGLTQEQVYYATGIHAGRIESGRANITITTLTVLCRHYKVLLSTFFEGVESRSAIKIHRPLEEEKDTKTLTPPVGPASAVA